LEKCPGTVPTLLDSAIHSAVTDILHKKNVVNTKGEEKEEKMYRKSVSDIDQYNCEISIQVEEIIFSESNYYIDRALGNTQNTA
jgi:hypothetical protein